MASYQVGSLVACRDREWVVLPSPQPDVLLLRPLGGGDAEVAGVYLPLSLDRVEPATFPLPDPATARDATAAGLLWNAARLSLRDGAGPFRSLGRISVRPRPYQFVPLLMALRLDPVRLLIADDVGIGKTIEAAVIARELLDRGEVSRLCVLCPPYLCDQWQQELSEKFHVEAVVVRSGTVAQLERDLPSDDQSIFGYYPHLVVSVDYAKSDRHRSAFLLHCPELVIVDEAHGCAQPAGPHRSQQQRHELLQRLGADPQRHLLLLTATPHSGVEESFRSLLGLLRPAFGELDLQTLREPERAQLARHLVQRRRADVRRWLGQDTPFPERATSDETYDLTPQYRALFDDVYGFARELVHSGAQLRGWRQRIRYWTALALLRCVMSSPAAAVAALEARAARSDGTTAPALVDQDASGVDADYAPYVYELTESQPEAVDAPADAVDVQPTHILEDGEPELNTGERRRLREFSRRANDLRGDADPKLQRAVQLVAQLLGEGRRPIVWCRYVATSDYLAEELGRRLSPRWPRLTVISVTGLLSDDERRERVKELVTSPQRVLVATDCLSEGINLQEHFDAVVHYDLPWNPNRLEQREGRVDRFGQRAAKVQAVLLYGRDNPVDGAVLDVLIRKANAIRRTLGVTVPVPTNSETVMEAVLQALFFREGRAPPGRGGSGQISLWEPDATQLPLWEAREVPEVVAMHREWDRAANLEQESRTRFAQHAIKPEEVDRELREADGILGDPEAAKRFVQDTCARLDVPLQGAGEGVWLLDTARLPELARPDGARPGQPGPAAPGGAEPGLLRITFDLPAPEGVTYLGRNHPVVAGLARHLLETALADAPDAKAARCGVVRTSAVQRRTTALLLRVRYLLEEPGKTSPLLAEESLAVAYQGYPPDVTWLPESDARDLITTAIPAENVRSGERHDALLEALDDWRRLVDENLHVLAHERARRLADAHRRVRQSVHAGRVTVRSQLPPDLLGLYVFLPVPKGVRR